MKPNIPDVTTIEIIISFFESIFLLFVFLDLFLIYKNINIADITNDIASALSKAESTYPGQAPAMPQAQAEQPADEGF